MKLIILMFTLVFLKSCGNTKEIVSAQGKDIIQNSQVLSGTYFVTKLGAREISTEELTITFNAKTNTVSGFSGCNQFSGTYIAEADRLECSQLLATEMMCAPEIDELERTFRRLLGSANTYELKEDTLVLKMDAGEVILAKKKTSRTKIIYEQMTRGFYEKIWVNSDSFAFSNDRALNETKSSVCKKEDWDVLLSFLKKLDVNSIPELEAPTKMHQYDGAAMATLTIELEGEIYKSNIFDHGYPPEPIAELVNKLLSMKKMMLKD